MTEKDADQMVQKLFSSPFMMCAVCTNGIQRSLEIRSIGATSLSECNFIYN